VLKPRVEIADWRPKQRLLGDKLAEEPGDRKVIFWQNTGGGDGKTTFFRNYLIRNTLTSIYVGGRPQDVLYALAQFKEAYKRGPRVVFMDMKRSAGEINRKDYEMIETLKDGVAFSSKYESGQLLWNPFHLVVATNFIVNMTALSTDRYDMITEEIGAAVEGFVMPGA